MKAIQLIKYGNAEEAFKIAEVEKPVPGDNEVLIKVEAFGLNFADVMARHGLYKAAPPIPGVLGYEVVGRIDETGESVTGIKKGTRVVAFTRFGGYAEYALTGKDAVFPIADDTSAAEATALSTQNTTAYFASYDMANIKEDEWVLIHVAAGGVGIALIQLALNRGARVIGTVGSQEKVDFIKGLGAEHAINYREKDFAEEINKLGIKPEVIFDPIGGKNFKKSLGLLDSGGRIVAYGASDQLNAKQGPLSKLKLLFGFGFHSPIPWLIKTQGILGVNMLKIADDKPHKLTRAMGNVVKMYEEGILKPHIAKEFKAEEIGEAHKYFESRKSIGKIVLHW